jgi:endonuclease I
MKSFFRNLFLLAFLFIISISGFAQIPAGYYDSAEGLEDEALRQALHNIIDGHTTVSYDNLWDVYEDSDKRSDGKVWDTYSNCNFTFGSDQCGSYGSICDCYNREHTVPQSWFNESSPMVSDAFHVIPTDGKVNGYRSNYPFGECNSGTTYGLGKLGSSTYPGYSGIVFEPADEYKGDMARIYFYMATRYMDVLSDWDGESFNGNNLSTWTINMMLQWHHDDPVSQKEIDRNNAVHDYQHNRNPYVDNPIWADAIWDPNYDPNYVELHSAFFTISPNPANDFIAITNNFSGQKNTLITITDISGRIIFEKELKNENETIDISTFITGSYFVNVSCDGRFRLTQKLLVIR